MTSRLQIRRDTQANWNSVNPVLLAGEIAYETDTGQIKVGNGSSTYVQLRYATRAATATSTSFTSNNPTLGVGEIAYETNTGLAKVGDGSTAYNSLAYARGVIRADTQANFGSTVFANGQPLYETDSNSVKIGNGTSMYTNLPYISGDYYRLTANGSAIGPAINYFFNVGYKVEVSSEYEFEMNVAFTKTTAGTVTFTFAAGFTIANLIGSYNGSPVGGVGAVGTPQFASAIATSGTTLALPATGSLTTGVNHNYIIKGMVETPASITNQFFGLQVTSSAGTVTPLRGSYMRFKRLPNANYGMF